MSKTSNMPDKEFFDNLFKLMFRDSEPRSIKKDYSDTKNINSKVCSQCGGKCCKRCGCPFSPDDFEDISFEYLKKELEKGYISIDYVDGEMILEDFGIYILRARNQDMPIVDVGFRRGTPCILLTEKGCKLDYEHRPSGGKLLVPDQEFESHESLRCHSNYDMDDCCHEWKPHQKILSQLVQYFKDKDIPCSL